MLIDPVRTKRGERDAARRKVEEHVSNLAALEGGHSSLADFDAITANLANIARAKDLVSAARQALAFKEKELAAAEVEQKRKDDDARHVAMQREASAGKKRVSALLAKLEALKSEVQWLIAHRNEVHHYNISLRGTDRETILNAEVLARRLPAQTIPAQFRDDSGWYDPKSGDRPSFLKRDEQGRLIPASQGNWHYEERRTQIAPERVEHGKLPESLTSSVGLARLLGLAG